MVKLLYKALPFTLGLTIGMLFNGGAVPEEVPATAIAEEVRIFEEVPEEVPAVPEEASEVFEEVPAEVVPEVIPEGVPAVPVAEILNIEIPDPILPIVKNEVAEGVPEEAPAEEVHEVAEVIEEAPAEEVPEETYEVAPAEYEEFTDYEGETFYIGWEPVKMTAEDVRDMYPVYTFGAETDGITDFTGYGHEVGLDLVAPYSSVLKALHIYGDYYVLSDLEGVAYIVKGELNDHENYLVFKDLDYNLMGYAETTEGIETEGHFMVPEYITQEIDYFTTLLWDWGY